MQSSKLLVIFSLTVLIGLAVFISMPSHHSRELSDRSVCAANLRGLTQSMNIYAADNSNAFPVLPFAPYTSGFKPSTNSSGTTNPDASIKQAFAATNPQAGSVEASMWVLVVTGQVSPKQFVCGSDRFVNRNNAQATDKSGNLYLNFQSPSQLSYSTAYPWNADGKPGEWWAKTDDASLPLIADMAPRQGTGKPARDVVPPGKPHDPKTWNSANHEGDGQNVGFADGHAEFQRRPDVGQRDDNIYSMSASPSKGPAQFGGIPAGAAAPMLTADKAPFDIIMLPMRDETTGKM